MDLAEAFFVNLENYAIVNLEQVKSKIGHEEIGFLHILSSRTAPKSTEKRVQISFG